MPGREKKDGQIYDSNLFSIASAIKEAGGIPKICEVIPDEEGALEKHIGENFQLFQENGAVMNSSVPTLWTDE